MKPLLFDTNVLLLFLRGDARWSAIYEEYDLGISYLQARGIWLFNRF